MSQGAALRGVTTLHLYSNSRGLPCGTRPAIAHFAVGGERYPTENLSPKQPISRQAPRAMREAGRVMIRAGDRPI